MKQTNVKPRSKNISTLEPHNRTLNSKNIQNDFPKTPFFEKRSKDFLFQRTIQQNSYQRKFGYSCKEQNESIEKENYQINNILPQRLKLKPKLLVNRTPLQTHKNATKFKNHIKKGSALPDTPNISSYLHTEESILLEEKPEELKKEISKDHTLRSRETKEKIQQQNKSREISNRNISSKSLVKKQSGMFPSIMKIETNHSVCTEKSEMFEYDDEKNIELTNDEKEIYGDRQLLNYQKGKLLGK